MKKLTLALLVAIFLAPSFLKADSTPGASSTRRPPMPRRKQKNILKIKSRIKRKPTPQKPTSDYNSHATIISKLHSPTLSLGSPKRGFFI